jgi:RNA polymerase sigma-70 factor, ECF subfamily
VTDSSLIIALKMFAEQSEQNSRDSSRESIISLPSATLQMTKAAALGDETACRNFFNQFCDRLYRYLLVLSRGDQDLSRDLVSISMIKAVRTIRPMNTDADIWRWLTTIARNSFIDQLRKNRRMITKEISHTLPAPDTDETLRDILNESVNELSTEEREIIERYYYENESQTELAGAHQTSRKAVESRLGRIRQKLRAAVLRKLS